MGTEQSVAVPRKFVLFLFILLRNYLTAGDVAAILQDHVNKLGPGEPLDFKRPNLPWLPGAAEDLACKLVEPRTFFTIDGVEDEFPAWHPDVVRYFDRDTAERMMTMMQRNGLLPAEGPFVSEHDTEVLHVWIFENLRKDRELRKVAR
jgi:hypothetical protein